MDISNQSAIVTGGASGLGAATAKHLSELGANVAIFDLNEELGASYAASIGATFFPVNITNNAEVREAIESVVHQQGAARVLVNCAGIVQAEKTLQRGKAHSPELFERVVSVNLFGTFNTLTIAAEKMSELEPLDTGERGLIVNTASIAAYEGQVGQIAYAASKGAIAGLTLPAARDLARVGIRVVSIAPGMFGTAMLSDMPEETKDRLAANVPFPPRLGYPEEYALLVEQICRNPMLNGTTLRLDGALRMQPR